MDPVQEPFLQRYKWHIGMIAVVVAPVVFYFVYIDPYPNAGGSTMTSFMLFLSAAFTLLALLALLWRISSIVETLKNNSLKMEEVARALGDITAGLSEISRSTRLSEGVKAIAFRDIERASLQEAVYQKMERQDFEGAYELIDEIAQRHEYTDLVDQLRTQVEQKHHRVRNEQIEEYIREIEKLLDEYQWSKASMRIEGLIKAYPDSERARSMRQRIHLKKEEHKKELMSAWDQAVKRQDTDASLDVLKELDAYLTPNEALALQEAARDVFRTKLHNLGVQFSIAVSDRKWANALDVGQRIIDEFPNSRMSEEIRTKMDVLRENVQVQA